MSATNRGRERERDDAYYTPSWCVRALLCAVRLPGGLWLEPACGEGAIMRAVNAERQDVRWLASDCREECEAAISDMNNVERWDCGDFTQDAFFQSWPPSVAITNPPYSLAAEFVERCLPLASVTIMLLRLNWLGSQKRAAFLRSHMPDVYVLPRRPSFVHGATDACEYMWAVWGPIASGVGRVQVLDLEDCR